MRVQKPIIIVGTGRCGSTMLHRLLACHEKFGWLSTFNEVFPTRHWLAIFSNLYRSPLLSDRVKHLTFFPKPFEAYRFWEHYLPGFSQRGRALTADDVPSSGIVPVRRATGRILHYQRRERLLVKVTGWSRVAYFDRIFPDARFVFLKREERAVVSSWIRAGWLDVTSSPESESWQWGEVPPPYFRLWKELGGTPILSAAVKIQMDLDDIQHNIAQFPNRSYQLQYEELIMDPIPQLQALLQFCDVPWTPSFEKYVRGMTFYNPIDKWKKYLSEADGELLMTFFERARGRQLSAV